MSVVVGEPTIALVGNPNTGKSTLFNALTGLRQRVGNYPGVTVERKEGTAKLNGVQVRIVDLPGTYSLAARSPDERVVVDVLLGQQVGERPVHAILAIVDASNLERNLYLVSQLMELGLPVVLALNMVDVAKRQGVSLNAKNLSAKLGVPVIETRADRQEGLDELRRALAAVIEKGNSAQHTNLPQFPSELEGAVLELSSLLNSNGASGTHPLRKAEVFRVLVDQGGALEERLVASKGAHVSEALVKVRKNFKAGASLAAMETQSRYAWITQNLADAMARPSEPPVTWFDRVDALLTHRLWGTIILVVTMGLVFQSIYAWASPLMDAIDGLLGTVSQFAVARIPEGMFQSAVVDGIIGGVGSVIVFLPQILILFFFVAVLEDCGYMARAAFLMDRLMGAVGLSGKSVIPLVSSFACAVPGIMATRAIPDRRVRLATILVAPLMSCSARLPVYVLLIGAFVPDTSFAGGWISLRGLALLGMHFVGVVVAIPILAILKLTLLRGKTEPFLMELPSFKWPVAAVVFRRMYDSGKEFVIRAGTIIFAVAIIVWALAYFPRPSSIHERYERLKAGNLSEEQISLLDQEEVGEYLRQSYLGRMGHVIEPVVRPLGWDWKIGMAALASFPAREVIISTLGTIYNLGSETDETSQTLKDALRDAKASDGRHIFTLGVALSIMVFFALCAQCGATLAVIRRETGFWRWPVIAFVYMTLLAYLGALTVYQTYTYFQAS